MIDTCTRFTAFYGTAMAGRVGYALGFTGLGVGATRFAGDVLLDLLAGDDTQRTRLEMVRTKPVPVPAGAGPVGRDRGHPALAREGGRKRGQGERLAEGDGPPGPRIRLMSRSTS